MAEQETLTGEHTATFNPLAHGLWSRVVDAGIINHAAWLRACAERGYVGTCRLCGDYLVPRPAEDHNSRLDYEAFCRNLVQSTVVAGVLQKVTGCGGIVCAPGGRVFTRSSRHSER